LNQATAYAKRPTTPPGAGR